MFTTVTILSPSLKFYFSIRFRDDKNDVSVNKLFYIFLSFSLGNQSIAVLFDMTRLYITPSDDESELETIIAQDVVDQLEMGLSEDQNLEKRQGNLLFILSYIFDVHLMSNINPINTSWKSKVS